MVRFNHRGDDDDDNGRASAGPPERSKSEGESYSAYFLHFNVVLYLLRDDDHGAQPLFDSRSGKCPTHLLYLCVRLECLE